MNPIQQAANNIRGGLTVLQVFNGFYIVMGIFSILGGLLGGGSLIVVENALDGAANLLLLLLGLLSIATGLIYIYLMAWIKDWQGRMAAWTAGQQPDRARVLQLAQTLGRWITFSQWAPIIGVGLGLLVVVVGGGLVGALLGSTANLGLDSSGALGSLGSAGVVSGVLLIAVVLLYGPVLVLNWLILASIRRWMDAVTDRATGRSSTAPINLMQHSNTVSGWLTFSQVILALLALLSLFSAFVPSEASTSTGGALFAALFVLLIYGLMLMMLQWSKTFLFGVAGYAERYGQDPSSGGGSLSLGK